MQKTVVIPYELFERLKNNDTSTNNGNGHSYEAQLADILKSDIPLEKKKFLYQQVLFNILRVDKDSKKDVVLPFIDNTPRVHHSPISSTVLPHTPPPSPTRSPLPTLPPVTTALDDITSNMYDELGKRTRKPGMNLYNLLRSRSNHIKWDNLGKVYIDNKPISLSNIIDIVADLASVNRSGKDPPTGFRELAPYIINMNIPHSLIKNKTRLKYIQSGGGARSRGGGEGGGGAIRSLFNRRQWIKY